MKNTVQALQDLYVAIGCQLSDVQNCSTIVEVLNAISVKYNGETGASLNPDAIENIAAVIGDSIPSGTKTITANGTHDVTAYESAEVAVPNPNSVQIITGTLTECVQNFAVSEEDFNIIYSSLSTGDVSIRLEADVSALGMGDIVIPLWDINVYHIGFGSTYWSNESLLGTFAFDIYYDEQEHMKINMFGSWDSTGTYTDLTPYADYIPATITIYWHPMSTNS